jgi:peroxiredoxin family protein
MKRIILILAFAVSSLASQAQTAAITPEARAQTMTTTMTQHLKLNAAQAAKVKEINLASIQQLEKAKKDHKNDPRKLKATMDLIGSTRLESLRSVLSYTQFLQYQQQREKKMGIPQQGNAGGVPQQYDN